MSKPMLVPVPVSLSIFSLSEQKQLRVFSSPYSSASSTTCILSSLVLVSSSSSLVKEQAKILLEEGSVASESLKTPNSCEERGTKSFGIPGEGLETLESLKAF